MPTRRETRRTRALAELSLADAMAGLAEIECGLWQDGGRRETDPAVRHILLKYWEAVVSKNAGAAAIRGRTAWSAAFVSWVARTAGAGDAFAYDPAHRNYFGAAKRARADGRADRFWAYRLEEGPLRRGDILIADRRPDIGAPCTGSTYATLDDGQVRPSHGDIVVAVSSQAIDAIGGNVSDSVKRKRIAVSAGGVPLAAAGACAFIGFLRLQPA